MGLLSRIMNRKCEALINRDEASSAELMADDYYQLVRKITKRKKISMIELSEEDSYEVKVDGVLYDLDEHIRHNDTVNTERMMEIEALLAEGVSMKDVQIKLNELVQAEPLTTERN